MPEFSKFTVYLMSVSRQTSGSRRNLRKCEEKVNTESTIRGVLLTILTRKDLCFTQFSTGMAVCLLLSFFICLHNQLSSVHSIITTQMFEKCDSSNRQ